MIPKHRGRNTPNGWPPIVKYIRSPVHSKTLTHAQKSTIQHISAKGCSDLTIQPLFCCLPTLVQTHIRKINDSDHPAHGQCGLFAARHLEPSSLITIYLGYVHGEDDCIPASNYDLALDREQGISVDATMMGNEARFVNDYRGVRKDGPNAEFKDCWVEVEITAGATKKRAHEKCIGIFVLGQGKSGKRRAGIAKGQEILVSYGKGFWHKRGYSGTTEETEVEEEIVPTKT